MNRKITKKRAKYWNISMIFYVLILFSGSAFLTNIVNTKAAPSSSFVSTDIMPTPTDTATPIPTSTSTPTPTATPTSTPAPTPAPRRTPRHTPSPTDTPADTPTDTSTPTPTPIPQPNSPPAVPPPTPTNGTVASPTATTTSTATATPTAVASLPTGPDDHPGQNVIQTQPDNPGSGSHAGGINGFGLSLGLGAPALLLLGGGLFWLYLRKNQQGVTALQKGKMSGLTTHTPWVRGNGGATNNAFLETSDTFTATIVPTSSFPYGTILPHSSNQDTVPGANVLQQSISPSPAELAVPLYGSSDLRPITMALPKQVANRPASALQPYPATSDMSPLPLEAFGLPHDTTQFMGAEHTPHNTVPTISPENLTPTSKMNSPIATPLSTAAKTLSVQPPDVAVDLMLQKVMRQAQSGLFIIPGQTKR